MPVAQKNDRGFGPKVQGSDHFKFGDHKKLKKLITKKTAAIMIETIREKVVLKKFQIGVSKTQESCVNKKDFINFR